MKAYRVTFVVVDHDGLGGDEIAAVVEDTRYPNRCIVPHVSTVEEVDIGEWSDEHPMNRRGADLDSLFDEFVRGPGR